MTTTTQPVPTTLVADFQAEADRARPYLQDLPALRVRSPLFPSVILPRSARSRRILIPLFWAEVGLWLGTYLLLAFR